VLDDKRPEVQAQLDDAPLMVDHLSDSSQAHYDAVRQYLTDLGVTWTEAPKLVRGLDYYTKTTFEFVHNGLGAQSAIGGGGRYDGLSAALGGPDVSGIETYFAAQQATGIPVIASWLPFLQKVANPRPNLESQSLAQFIQQQLVARTQAVNRGTKAQQFYVLANVRHPAVLVEGGFLTGKNDIGKLADANYRELLAMGITDGILEYRDTVKALAGNGAEASP